MSASSGCPTASWKSTPPIPGASTTAVSPAGAGTASSIVIARRAATSAVAEGGLASMNSAPARPAGPVEPRLDRVVAPRHRGHREPDPRPRLLHPSSVAGRDQQALDRVRVRRAHLPDLGPERAGRLVGLADPRDLAFGRDRGGIDERRMHDGRLEAPEVDDRARPAVAHRCGGRLGRVQERVAVQPVRVRVPERRPVPDADAGAAVQTGGDLLDLAVVQAHRDPQALLDVQLRERAAAGTGGAEDLRGEIAVEHGAMLTAADRRTGRDRFRRPSPGRPRSR